MQKNRQRATGTVRVFLAILMLAVALFQASAGLAEAEDVIRVSSRSEPQSVISEQDVSITIKVYNTGTEDVTGAITLFNSEGQSVETYQGLKAGQTVTYTGTWHVTAEQISKGRISYFIRYPSSVEGAEPLLRTIPITIQTEAPAPQLTATYTVSPMSARPGQQVTATYTLSNTGNIELRGISIANPGFSDRTLTAASLSVGERLQLTDSVTMGEKELVSEPTVTYRSADSDRQLTVNDLGKRTITVAENGLEATLSSEDAENVYPGAQVNVKLALRNTGETALQNITATLSDGTQVLSLAELAAGGSYEATARYTPSGDGEITADVQAETPAGDAISITSNALSVTMQDLSTALVLSVRAGAETETMYSEPAVMRFAVEVRNVGETDAATLTVSEAGTTVGTIPSLPSGESRTLVFDAELSMAGQVQFAVTGKDALGNERTYTSNIIETVYVAPTPAPTAAPTPTPVPPTPSPAPTATPEPTLMERIEDAVDPMILRIALAVIAGLIVLAIVLRALSAGRKKRRLAAALDTMDAESDVRDSFGKRRGRRRGKAKESAEPEQIVTTSELTEEEAAARDQSAGAEDESRRRRHTREQTGEEKTLRVAPAGERPENPERPEANDSRTRIYDRVSADAAEETKVVRAVKEPEERTQQNAEGETVRLDRRSIDALREQAEQEEPVKKRGLRGLFGGKPKDDAADEDEDLYE